MTVEYVPVSSGVPIAIRSIPIGSIIMYIRRPPIHGAECQKNLRTTIGQVYRLLNYQSFLSFWFGKNKEK